MCNHYNDLIKKEDEFFFLVPYIRRVYIGCRTKDTVEYKMALEKIQSLNIEAKEKNKNRKKDLIKVLKYTTGKSGYTLKIDDKFDYNNEIERLRKINNLEHENKTCKEYPCKSITKSEEK